jgi:hypothetical protein
MWCSTRRGSAAHMLLTHGGAACGGAVLHRLSADGAVGGALVGAPHGFDTMPMDACGMHFHNTFLPPGPKFGLTPIVGALFEAVECWAS